MVSAETLTGPTLEDRSSCVIADHEKCAVVDWKVDFYNPQNWPAWKKVHIVAMLSMMAFTTTFAASVISPAQEQLMAEFKVSGVTALLPMALFVLALAFGPLVGGPLSETLGRLPIYRIGFLLGSLLTLGAGLTSSFGALCFLRFATGFCWAPTLAVVAGSIAEAFKPKKTGLAMAVLVLVSFLGPALGPILGSFIVRYKDWRWTQWVTLFSAVCTIILILTSEETFHPILKKQLAKKRGQLVPPVPPLSCRIRTFATVGLLRPMHMFLTEPIVTFICLYMGVNFAILFSFFTAVPYTFSSRYSFSQEESGLVFFSVAIGYLLSFATIMVCDVCLYRCRIVTHSPRKVPPEQRLYAAMLGSFGLPVSLFWFAWTARPQISWVSPATAIIPFAWGNLCVYFSTTQYYSDTYHRNVVASVASAASLVRYTFAGVFPLFINQMYDRLGIEWATSLLGFLTIALLPVPWVLFMFGPQIRCRSKYETVVYN